MSVGVGTDNSGRPLNTVNLFPGGFAYHLVFSEDYCKQSTRCPAAEAGLFDYENSVTANRTVTPNPGLVWTQGSNVARKEAGNASILLDTMTMTTPQGALSVYGSAIDAVHDKSIMLPDGSSYAPQVGSLALGSPEGERKYPKGSGKIIPNYLSGRNITPSASTGLHYGSAQLGPEGSLVWGGYDQSRVIGDVGSFELFKTDSLMIPNLLDIQLGVERGVSPFQEQSPTGLLNLNNSFGLYQPTVINPVLPYLFMAPDTCSNIAKYLPVTFNQLTGLYAWNTDDPQYNRIIGSPAYLAFVFRSGGDNSAPVAASNLTIKVPFKLLNLTLESPIVQTPQQYFPCYPFTASDGSGNYFFGRAFLQAAFVAMNFNQSTFFLAQAPGPDAEPPNIQSISASNTTIKSTPADGFARSWAKHWTPLSETTPAPTRAPHGGSDLPKGAIAGISVAVVLFVLFSGLAALFLFVRHRRRQKPTMPDEQKTESHYSASVRSGLHEKDTRSPISEAGGNTFLAHEAPAQEARAELADDGALPELPPQSALGARNRSPRNG